MHWNKLFYRNLAALLARWHLRKQLQSASGDKLVNQSLDAFGAVKLALSSSNTTPGLAYSHSFIPIAAGLSGTVHLFLDRRRQFCSTQKGCG